MFDNRNPKSRPKRKPKPNPISNAIILWIDTLPPPLIETTGYGKDDLREELVKAAPKRWVVYYPMVLLPSGSFASDIWENVLIFIDETRKAALWSRILGEIASSNGARGAGTELTHLAVNEGIPAQTARVEDGNGAKESYGASRANLLPDSKDADGGVVGRGEEENVIRSPTNLHMLHGDFGPEPTEKSRLEPTTGDFNKALWVSTKQNGIWQTWAPRYTMFSRGNVKEKARLLAFHNREHGRMPDKSFAVDLYAGIGYFAFSYAKLGMRVLCWEINPWSVEAMRRGALHNGWSIEVIQEHQLDDPEWFFYGEHNNATLVVYMEDNQMASARVEHFRNNPPNDESEIHHVVHVNCGLLPSSTPTWRDALDMIDTGQGWLHLHENVGVADIESRKKEIQGVFGGWIAEHNATTRRNFPQHEGDGRKAVVEHVEQVKTFAPGVWHCVFDVCITRPQAVSSIVKMET